MNSLADESIDCQILKAQIVSLLGDEFAIVTGTGDHLAPAIAVFVWQRHFLTLALCMLVENYAWRIYEPRDL